MTAESRDRLFGWQSAFDSPFVLWASIGIAVLLVASLAIASS